eukprot:TRINITY_DN12909_c1_g1_i6.p1 TRINITY_DN12909_c1_g1~~TRINITY_DN12909_c1_g1_i6.p1  ORF type:complete len:126 (-),score=22.87 TRINITY_DN12909_c1_g1_i6:408-785(-)
MAGVFYGIGVRIQQAFFRSLEQAGCVSLDTFGPDSSDDEGDSIPEKSSHLREDEDESSSGEEEDAEDDVDPLPVSGKIASKGNVVSTSSSSASPTVLSGTSANSEASYLCHAVDIEVGQAVTSTK